MRLLLLSIAPAYSVAPNVFQIGQTPNVLLSLTNQNPNAAQQLRPGDVFTFTLGVPYARCPRSRLQRRGRVAGGELELVSTGGFQDLNGSQSESGADSLPRAAHTVPGGRHNRNRDHGDVEPSGSGRGKSTPAPASLRCGVEPTVEYLPSAVSATCHRSR